MNPNAISKVRVIVRVRPFLPHEIDDKNGDRTPCVSVLDQDSDSGEEVSVYLKDKETSRNECYRLDSFFGQEDYNLGRIFYKEVSPLIPGIFFHGCNATVFAYGATGSGKINQSLFALSNVIFFALNNNKPRVPYRESKLTRILQDSLGGTSSALMVACLNPGEYQESVHTVSLAARSRHISNFVSSAHKLETPRDKVDMEAKLRAWLESKGKTKSAQRIGAFNSPFMGKTPSSINSVKKPSIHHSSVKAKATTNQGACKAKQRFIPVPFTNLFNDKGQIDACFESGVIAAMPNTEVIEAAADGIVPNSKMFLPDEALDKEDNIATMHSSANCVGSSPAKAKRDVFKSSRKVLSPIDTNVNLKHLEGLSSTDQSYTVLLEPITPKRAFIGTSANKLQTTSTPLDKFSTWSCNLKSSLIQEYISFLNTASKEELLGLKGIGEKMAEYISELRETSPLKSLNDLEKIGLSSKQVHNLFSRATSGIFDRADDSTPSCSEQLQ